MNLSNALLKRLYWPQCRTYARILGDRPADHFFRLMCSVYYWYVYRYWPNFLRPRRFTEKVWRRMLYERDPIFTLISDKLQVRDYVADRGGEEHLVPLLWIGKNPDEIPFDELPPKFVIKANHGCDYNILVANKDKLSRSKIVKQLNKWLDINFGSDSNLGIAWGYKKIKPRVFIEIYLEEDGHPPKDYKFYCFAGRVEFFKIDYDRFDDHSEIFFDKNLTALDLYEEGLKIYRGQVDLPLNIRELIFFAESLANEFDFIRVDLYSIGNKIYFSELTPYPGGVSAKFEPTKYDVIYGDKWILKEKR